MKIILKISEINIFQEYAEKINLLEKNFDQKYTEQLNEINNLKNIKNKFIIDIDNIKKNLTQYQKNLDYIKNITEKNILMNKISNTNDIQDHHQLFLGDKNNNNNNNVNININSPYKKLLLEKKKEPKVQSTLNNIDNRDKNINILDSHNNIINIQNCDEKTNSENTLENYTNMRMNKINMIEHSKSFDKTQNNEISLKNYYSDEHNEFKNTKESLAFTQDDFFHERVREQDNNLLNLEMKKSIPRMHFDKYVNFKKNNFPNNYSITNIPNIKIKKVVLPETLNHRNKLIKMSRSSLLNPKGKRVLSNYNPLLSKKNFFQSAENITNTNTVNKNTVNNYNITKINRQKSSKMRSIKFVESARIISRKPESKKTENLNHLIAVQPKAKYSMINSANNLRKSKIRNWSFEKYKKEKDEKTQLVYKNTYNAKNQFKELLLVNAKNLKKNRKIKM